MQQPTITRLIELQQLLLQFHTIERRVHHPSSNRRETDTEHSYTLAIAGWFLAQYFPDLDTDKIIRMALVHDLIEIHAGDTFVFGDQAAIDSKPAREAAAVETMQNDWQDFHEMNDAIHQYESRQSPEAKFVYALDKVMPIILNYLNEGKAWRKNSVTFEQFVAEKEAKVPLSPEIYVYYKQLLALLEEHLDFFAPQPTPKA